MSYPKPFVKLRLSRRMVTRFRRHSKGERYLLGETLCAFCLPVAEKTNYSGINVFAHTSFSLLRIICKVSPFVRRRKKFLSQFFFLGAIYRKIRYIHGRVPNTRKISRDKMMKYELFIKKLSFFLFLYKLHTLCVLPQRDM